jgi:hypothetical protein
MDAILPSTVKDPAEQLYRLRRLMSIVQVGAAARLPEGHSVRLPASWSVMKSKRLFQHHQPLLAGPVVAVRSWRVYAA